MGSTQLYSLTWGEFGTSLVSAVQLLRCHNDLVDVTLAAGGRSFPAHKIVLCAASPFLLNLLKSTPCQHPVVMLAGVTAPDLEALLEFVYRGEVSVDSSQLPSLLQAAHCLNIQGLAPGTISAERPEEITLASTAHDALTRDVINSFLPIRRRKRTKRRNSTGSQGKWARQDSMSGDSENRPLEGSGSMSMDHDVLMDDVPRKLEDSKSTPPSEDMTSAPGSVEARSSSAGTPAPPGSSTAAAAAAAAHKKVAGGTVSDQPAQCPLCGAMLRQSRNLRRHLELLHFGVGRSTVRVRSRKLAQGQDQGQPESHSPGPTQGRSQGPQGQAMQTLQQVDSGQTPPHPQQQVAAVQTAPNMHSSPSQAQSQAHSQPQQQPQQQVQVQGHSEGGPTLVQMVQMVPAAQHLMVTHPTHCQPQVLTPMLSRVRPDDCSHLRAGSGSCDGIVLGGPGHGLLPAMPSPHDPAFRQHHAELLRGAGLYADARPPPSHATAPGPPAPSATAAPRGATGAEVA